jgi:single-strand DNA-binding protein
MNKVVLLGRLTKDPEIRYSQKAEPVAIATFTLAVNRRFRREGEQDADFIGCVSFGKSAEFAEKYLKKGMQIAVSGRLQVRTYDDATGQRRWITEVVVEDSEFTESRSAYEARMAQQGQYQAQAEYAAPAPMAAAPKPPPVAPSYSPPAQGGFEPEGFAAITESIDDDDLPF